MKLAAISIILFVSQAVVAQETLVDPPWIKDVATQRIFYSVPGMKDVGVKRNVVYRRVDGRELPADIYTPKGKTPAKGHPVILFVHGGALPPNLKTTIKDWGVYVSYGELAAASGFVGITFNTRFFDWAKVSEPQSDIREMIAYVRANAKTLGADPDRIHVWAFSGGGLLLGDLLADPDPAVKSIAAFYPVMDPQNVRSRMPAGTRDEYIKHISPSEIVRNASTKMPPLLIGRAGLDKDLIAGVDEFIQTALAKNLAIEFLNHANGRHAFDVLDDNERTREIIRRTIEFFKSR